MHSFPKKAKSSPTQEILGSDKDLERSKNHGTSICTDTKDDGSSFVDEDLNENPGVISVCGYSRNLGVNSFLFDKRMNSSSTLNVSPVKAECGGPKTDPSMESVEMGDMRKNILIKKSEPGGLLAHSHENGEIYRKKGDFTIVNGHPRNFSEKVGRNLNTDTISSSSSLLFNNGIASNGNYHLTLTSAENHELGNLHPKKSFEIFGDEDLIPDEREFGAEVRFWPVKGNGVG